MLVERIDEDKDGYVTAEEMKKWIKHAQKRWIYDDVDRQWKSHDLNGDEVVSWEEYKNATYGYILGMAADNLLLFIYLMYPWSIACVLDGHKFTLHTLHTHAHSIQSCDLWLADDPDPDDGFSYRQMMNRDERRFKMADQDNDMKANKEEFTAFLHPEEYDHMKDIVVLVSDTRTQVLNDDTNTV